MPAFVCGPGSTFYGTKLKVDLVPRCPVRRPRHSLNTRASISQPEVPSVQNDEERYPAQKNLDMEITDGNSDTEQESTSADESAAIQDWYTISKPISKPDTGAKPFTSGVETLVTKSDDGIVDLGALDGVGREMLTGASYDHVVDVNIEDGGVLEIQDEDNNDLFCGVGLDALVENDQIIKNLHEGLNIVTATHVQLAGIPRVLEGEDIVIQSHTGTGKTLAFLLPLLDNIDEESTQVQAIIVAPTRELAMQIFRECERLCEGTGIRSVALIGGANPTRQADKLRRMQPHIAIGTPGRVAEMEENRELRVSGVNMLVIDEVDQCMQEAFVDDVVYLLRAAPRKIQKVLVSATSDVDSVRAFAGKHLHKPILLRVAGSQRLPKNITHWYCVVPARLRIELLRKLMHTSPAPARAIAFVDDPRRVDLVVERLYNMKIVVGALRGNAHKLERAEVLSAFRAGKIQLLVTTEVAARGLDIPEITHVFNVDLPTDGDHYVHRAGRCGRAGRVGTVVSITTADTAFVIGRLEKELGVPIRRMEPRRGRYGEAIQRTREGSSRQKTVVERRKSEQGIREGSHGGAEVVGDRTNKKGQVKSEESGEEDLSGAWEGKGVDEVLQLWQQEAREVDSTFEDSDNDGVDGKKSKKEKKKKKEKVREKVKVKVRARDLKNKGKPKGRLGRGNREDTEDLGSESERSTKKRESSFSEDEENGLARPRIRKAPRDLRVRAKQQGWVGNR